MNPIEFSDANIRLVKPEGMTDEECYSLSAFKGVDNAGYEYFLTLWQPSKEDIDAILEGRGIYLKVYSPGFYPVAIFTVDKEGKHNDAG